MRHPVYNIFLAGVIVLLALPSAQASVAGGVNKGNQLYDQGQFDGALDLYQKALKKDPDSLAIEYNVGTALYKKGDYANAIEHFNKALLSDDPQIQSKAQFNLGNTYYKAGAAKEQSKVPEAITDLEKSLTHYQKLLEQPQQDPDAQSNYEFVKKELERLKQKQEEQNQQQQQQDQKSQQDQQNQHNKDQQSSQDNKDSGQDKKDQSNGQDAQDENKKENQEEKPGPEDEQNQNKENEGQDSQKEKPSEDSKDQSEKKENSVGGGNEGEPSPAEQQGGDQGNDQGMITPQEAQMVLDDYQRNDEPKGILYFKPQQGKDKPVQKDW